MKPFEEVYDAVSPILRGLEDRRLAAAAHARKIGKNLLIATGGVLLVILAVMAQSNTLQYLLFSDLQLLDLL